jgi:hypothetical protein
MQSRLTHVMEEIILLLSLYDKDERDPMYPCL